MDGEHGGLSEERVERRHAVHPQGLEPLLSDVWVIRQDSHAKRVRPRGDLAADAPQADNTKGPPAELAAKQRGAIPAPLTHRLVGTRHVPQQRHHRAEKQLGHRHSVARRGVDDGDPQFGRQVCGNVVDSHPRAPHNREAGRGAQ
jgi:hypothetical protein